MNWYNLLDNIYGTIIPIAVYKEMRELDYNVPGTVEVQTLSWIEEHELKISYYWKS